MKKGLNQKGGIAIILCILLAIVALGAGVFGFLMRESSKEFFSKVIKESYESINNSITDDLKTVSGSISVLFKSGDGKLKDVELSTEYGIDRNSKYAELSINTKYNNKNLLAGNVYLQEDKLYLYAKELINEFFTYDVKDVEKIFESDNTESAKVVFEKIEAAVQSSLKDEYFTKESGTFAFDGKEKKATKTTLVLNEKNATELGKSVTGILVKDKEFLKAYSKVTGDTEAVIEDEMNKYISGETDVDENYYIVDGENIREEEFKDLNISLFTTGLFTKKLEQVEIVRGDNKVVVDVISDTTYKYVALATTESYDGTKSVDEVKGTIEVTETNDESTVKITAAYEKYNIELTVKNYKNKPVEADVIKEGTPIISITDAQYNKIMEKIQTNEAMMELIQDISGLFAIE